MISLGWFQYTRLFSGKENELWNAQSSTSHWVRGERYQYFGARYDDPVACSWTVVDPLAEKYPGITPYAYCAGDPVNMVDPDGNASGDYYLNGFHVYDDGVNDGKKYEIPLIENCLRTRITWGRPILVANERSIKLSFSGIANDLRPSLAEGTVSVIQEGTNGREYTKMIISGVGGPYGNGAPQNGEYSVDTPRIRAESGFTKNRVGFSFNLNPLFETKRKYLRIHPDGNSPGTLGCVGLNASEKDLNTFFIVVSSGIAHYGDIRMTIDIQGNPNNSGGASIPNINE